MILLAVLVLINATYTTNSLPIGYYTYSNPAFTALWGNYHVYIEPKDIGDLAVFNCSAKFKYWGVGFSNMRIPYERRNWVSIAHHFPQMPISAGCNVGLYRNTIMDETHFYSDLGIWYRNPLSIGLTFNNFTRDERILRGGVSYTWRFIAGTFELEDSLQTGEVVPHMLVSLYLPWEDFLFMFHAGLHPSDVSLGAGIDFRRFITAQVFYEEEETKVLIGIHFRPAVVVREIAVVETLTVKHPVIVERTIIKKESSPKHDGPVTLTEKQKAYCEEHYMKGIEYYVVDDMKNAIKEWSLVTKVDPDYKDVQRYLENARAKQKLLEEE